MAIAVNDTAMVACLFPVVKDYVPILDVRHERVTERFVAGLVCLRGMEIDAKVLSISDFYQNRSVGCSFHHSLIAIQPPHLAHSTLTSLEFRLASAVAILAMIHGSFR